MANGANSLARHSVQVNQSVYKSRLQRYEERNAPKPDESSATASTAPTPGLRRTPTVYGPGGSLGVSNLPVVGRSEQETATQNLVESRAAYHPPGSEERKPRAGGIIPKLKQVAGTEQPNPSDTSAQGKAAPSQVEPKPGISRKQTELVVNPLSEDEEKKLDTRVSKLGS
ncbi:hypothetical protein BJ508DRAFT_377929 [Ascobolus immersus RN42]|uniref:Uncharacterized protein n=1 Tax=Ascobolus immersus RN42 TaxID=1160509 RepID=A0A3N4I2T5_ASCIM|nr:hypothetical protein BJ508DRAFT_377929 [Ascobolus immersus RN42]